MNIDIKTKMTNNNEEIKKNSFKIIILIKKLL